MKPAQAWQSVLGQLQLEMPKASFDTWVRNTESIGLENGVLTVSAPNSYAREWLESRLTSIVQRLLIGVLNQSVAVQFVVQDSQDAAQEPEDQEDDVESEVVLDPLQWLDYDKIVQPHKQVVVKGYLRRLGMEIGPKAIWLYIGFHQAAWRLHADAKESGLALHSRDVMRFSGLSFGAFWRSLRCREIQSGLRGLVQRVDLPGERKYHRGRDGRPHRIPIRYQVFMTPRLSRADSNAIHSRLKNLLEHGGSMPEALRDLLAAENILDLLTPVESAEAQLQLNTVMDMARLESGDSFTTEIDHLAQELHRKIVGALGDIHIPHFFLTETIHRFNLTPAQAWLVTVARDMAYVNWRTGERREVVTFKRGYQEMAELVDSRRYKTVQAWFNPQWQGARRGGELTRFLTELELQGSNTYSDLRVESMPRTYRVLLDEPLDANGTNGTDAHGRNNLGADGSNSRTRAGALAGAHGSNMADANGSDLNTLKHRASTDSNNTPTTQNEEGSAGAVPQFWVLETLLEQNDVHPKVQRELLEAQASVHAFVSWVLYVASPASGHLSDPLGYALSRLREHPLREARGVFRQFASLPPSELLLLIDSTPRRACALPSHIEHPLADAWIKAMGSNNSILPAVRTILFGEGDHE